MRIFHAVGSICGITHSVGNTGPFATAMLQVDPDSKSYLKIIAFDEAARSQALKNTTPRLAVVARLEERKPNGRLVVKDIRPWTPDDGDSFVLREEANRPDALDRQHARQPPVPANDPSLPTFRSVSRMSNALGYEEIWVAATPEGALVRRFADLDCNAVLTIDVHPAAGGPPQRLHTNEHLGSYARPTNAKAIMIEEANAALRQLLLLSARETAA